MFVLPILPDELRLSLEKVKTAPISCPSCSGKGSALTEGEVKPCAVCGGIGNFTADVCDYPGVTAVVRPLDVEAASRWNDAFPGSDHRSMAATQLVFDQLIRIEGLSMRDASGAEVPFDATNPVHKRSIPMDMRSGIYLGLKVRATLSEEQEKNSGSPSDSGGTSGTESTSAEAVASEQKTS